MKHFLHRIFFRFDPTRLDSTRLVLFSLLFSFCLLPLAFPEIRTRLSPSAHRTLESAGAVMVYNTPATVNGARATLSAYTFPAPPSAASAETARLLNLPFVPAADGSATSSNKTHLIVLPAADPRQSLLFLTQYETAPDPGRAVEFPKGLPHPGNAEPVFSATLDATRTSFASATSLAPPEEIHADMAGRLAAQKWRPALPATFAKSMEVYSRGNAVFIVHTAPQPDGSTRFTLLQRLTSNP